MKKFLTLVLAIVLMMSFCAVSLAEGETPVEEVTFAITDFSDKDESVYVTADNQLYEVGWSGGYIFVCGGNVYRYNGNNNWDKWTGDEFESIVGEAPDVSSPDKILTEVRAWCKKITHQFTSETKVCVGDREIAKIDDINAYQYNAEGWYLISNFELIAYVNVMPAPKSQTVVTVDVERNQSYIFHIPKDTAIEADVTTAQELTDSVYVSNLENMDGKKVVCAVTTQNLSSGTDEIETTWLYKTAAGMEAPAALTLFDCGVNSENGTKIYAKVDESAWQSAKTGHYSATISFSFAIENDAEPEISEKAEWSMSFSIDNKECYETGESQIIGFNPAVVSNGNPEIVYSIVSGEGGMPSIPDNTKPELMLPAAITEGEYCYTIEASVPEDDTHKLCRMEATFVLTVHPKE